LLGVFWEKAEKLSDKKKMLMRVLMGLGFSWGLDFDGDFNLMKIWKSWEESCPASKEACLRLLVD